MTLTAMPKYDAYKDSGVEWLGHVPSHWVIQKMKFLFKDTSIKNRAEQTLLSVTQDQGVVPRDWVENRMVMPSGNLESFKYIQEGDFAISLRSFEGGLEYCHHNGIISPAYTVLKKNRDDLVNSFYKYLFKSQTFISELQTSIVGIREGKNISYEELRYSYLPIPSKSEQTAIANFLDAKTTQIDEAIAIKEQQIALLNERKQILTQQAVTQGLDPTVPMKDSGVEWIGKIPEHWEIKKVKHLGHICSGGSIVNSQLSDEGLYEVFGGNGLMGYCDNYNVEDDSIIIGRVGALCGNVRLTNERKWISDNALILKLHNNNNYTYISDILEIADLNKLNSSNAQPLITGTKVLNFNIPIAPYAEQQGICEFIKLIKTKHSESEKLLEEQINRLKEYKTTLINSAVTGKIKVV